MNAGEADAVFQGGGVKGTALVGALLEFEHRGYSRWVNLAGTSAGAIVAAYIACGHTATEAEALLRATPYSKFEDTAPGGHLIGGAIDLVRHHGVAHGEYFRRWFDEAVEGRTFAGMRRDDGAWRLRMIAADVTRREMLVLPGDLAHYRAPGGEAAIDPDTVPVADAVRMSMSIPYFFEPVELVHHQTGVTSTIVDGGILSNFPVWLFDVSDRDPLRPTFGFRLVGGGGVGGGLERLVDALGWPVRMATDMWHTATDAWDERFMTHSTLVRSLPIDCDGVGTTDFGITPAQQDLLIGNGRAAAATFLDGFDVSRYVNTYGRRLT